MANLLPIEYRKTVKMEIARRFIVIFTLFFLVLVFTQLVFFLVMFFWLKTAHSNLNSELELTKNLALNKNLEGLELEAEELNWLLDDFQKGRTDNQSLARSISGIIGVLPADIMIDSFIIDSGEAGGQVLKITGKAKTRDDLIAFIEKLKTSSLFGDVMSPITNILSAKDVRFSVIINLK